MQRKHFVLTSESKDVLPAPLVPSNKKVGVASRLEAR